MNKKFHAVLMIDPLTAKGLINPQNELVDDQSGRKHMWVYLMIVFMGLYNNIQQVLIIYCKNCQQLFHMNMRGQHMSRVYEQQNTIKQLYSIIKREEQVEQKQVIDLLLSSFKELRSRTILQSRCFLGKLFNLTVNQKLKNIFSYFVENEQVVLKLRAVCPGNISFNQHIGQLVDMIGKQSQVPLYKPIRQIQAQQQEICQRINTFVQNILMTRPSPQGNKRATRQSSIYRKSKCLNFTLNDFTFLEDEIMNYQKQISDLKNKNQEKQISIEALNKKIRQQMEVFQKDGRIEQLRLQKCQLNAKLQRDKLEIDDLRRNIKTVEVKLSEKQQRFSQQHQQVQKINSQIVQLEDTTQIHDELLRKKDQQLSSLKSFLESLKCAQKTESQNFILNRKKYQSSINTLKQEAEKEKNKFSSEIEQKSKEIISLKKENERQIKNLVENSKKALLKEEKLNQELHKFEREVELMKKQITRLNEQLSKLTEEKDRMKTTLAKRDEQSKIYKKQLTTLQEQFFKTKTEAEREKSAFVRQLTQYKHRIEVLNQQNFSFQLKVISLEEQCSKKQQQYNKQATLKWLELKKTFESFDKLRELESQKIKQTLDQGGELTKLKKQFRDIQQDQSMFIIRKSLKREQSECFDELELKQELINLELLDSKSKNQQFRSAITEAKSKKEQSTTKSPLGS